MPRALYRMARGLGTKGNQDPHLLTAKGGRPSSHQVKDYVLCWDCEQRFSKNGEHYVMGLLTKRNKIFPLLEMLNNVAPTMKGPSWKMYSSSDTPIIDRDKVAYFAISVFWRASVHTWELENGEQTRIRLGDKYNEQVRKYLLGETSVPKNASLQVIVCSDVTNQNTFFPPQENQKVRDRSVIFLARGVLFFFRMSSTLQGFQQRLSVVNNKQGWITTRNCADRPVWAVG
ncbi:MAG: hypothetical protein WAN10_04140 [Candidatus Acidiferrales bacterium]